MTNTTTTRKTDKGYGTAMATGSKTLKPGKPPRRSRADTERKLIDVALDLIRRKGVLAGLNLREVAQGAGVNRGNIYHYFGSRQELLRAAINHRFAAMTDALKADRNTKTFIERRLRAFRARDTSRDSELRALLVIDGDDTLDPMPMYESVLSQLRQEVINGEIDRGHDLAALQVALNAVLRGYRIFRLPYARRLGIRVSELDDRVTRIVRVWLEAMQRPPRT